MFKITNGWDKDFCARFNGIEFAFPKDTPVYCEDAAAAHIFGIAQEDKTAVLARHGWATFTNTLADGMKILNSFSFEHVDQPLDAPLAREIVDHGPAPVIQNAPTAKGVADEARNTVGAVEEKPAGYSKVFKKAA